jgi:hypothetical protein
MVSRGDAERLNSILFIQVFAHRYRTGIAPKGKLFDLEQWKTPSAVGPSVFGLGDLDPPEHGNPDFASNEDN